MELKRRGEDVPLRPARPLWQLLQDGAHTREHLGDFMLLIPGIRDWPQIKRDRTFQLLQELLAEEPRVVIADLNLRLNLLWISHRQGQGVVLDLFQAIRAQVPEALLVASQAEAMHGMGRKRRGVFGRLLSWSG